MLEELNVKKVIVGQGEEDAISLDTKLTPELKREGMTRDVIRQVQESRKKAGLDVSDRIILQLTTADKELEKAINENSKEICSETLATLQQNKSAPGFEIVAKIDKSELTIGITKKITS